MIVTANGKKRDELQEEFLPVRIVKSLDVEYPEGLMNPNLDWVSFKPDGFSCFQKKGSYVLLDFGKELCGGIRIITKGCGGMAKWRLTFGESLTEACASVGEKNSTNDHSPRDFEILTSQLSDLRFGQTGFRFVRIELLTEAPATVQNIWAVSYLPKFEQEAKIVTNDALLNEIIETAAYTLKLNFQKGYIWDGIKRDRLVWSGDLHPEIITSLYMFGDNENIKNSLTVLRDSVGADGWINTIPSYSAWWVINLCDYCKMTGNWLFFHENREYALKVLKHFDDCIKDNGEVVLTDGYGMEYFLDWSTFGYEDATIGVSALLCMMAQKFVLIEENENCRSIIEKLSPCLEVQTTMKPVRAFQVLAGRHHPVDDVVMLQQNGAQGFSTFMAYYILTAIAKVGGKNMLEILKTYYGGMLLKGATTFWEDFDIAWLEGSGRIDEFPQEGQKDIHGDFGKHCYTQFRHSLCHGWSSGVLAFIIEYVLGVHIADGTVNFEPHLMGLTDIEAEIPINGGVLTISIHEDGMRISAPDDVEINQIRMTNMITW